MAAIESRGDGSATTAAAARSGQLGEHLLAVGRAGHHQHPVAGRGADPGDGLLEQRCARYR